MTPRILPFLALITLILVTGCGVKGDLYLPDDRDAADSEEGMS
ncbi:LPS translocon maturation chaperone LptM [Spiribacter vilamensis]|nr:lipoprotein [Spiribacter vilamensis]